MNTSKREKRGIANLTRELTKLREQNGRMYVALIGICREPNRAAEIADAALWPNANNRHVVNELDDSINQSQHSSRSERN